MSHSDPSRPESVRETDASGSGGQAPVELPPAAQRTLDELAAALGVTTALLGGRTGTADLGSEDPATLLEASALLQAFVQIDDAQARKRCLAFVQRAADEVTGT